MKISNLHYANSILKFMLGKIINSIVLAIAKRYQIIVILNQWNSLHLHFFGIHSNTFVPSNPNAS